MAKKENPKIKSLPSIEVKLTTENVKEEHINAVEVEWLEDHSDWKSYVEKWQDKEERAMPPNRLKFRLEKSNDNAQIAWDTQWPEPEVTKWKEVYGVLRAEFYFGKSLGYKKIASKVNGNHGIDSLFFEEKNNRYHIVESKCTADIKKYQKYKYLKHGGMRAYNYVNQKLGKINPKISMPKLDAANFKSPEEAFAKIIEDYDDFKAGKNEDSITLSIIQMSWEWVSIKCAEMLLEGGNVEKNGKSLSFAMRNKEKKIKRWFNFYGTNPFYRLPGKYKITGVTSAEFKATKEELNKIDDKEFGWPDGRGRKIEFICLDDYEPFNKNEEKKKNIAAKKIQGVVS